jgi:hypothetical protein
MAGDTGAQARALGRFVADGVVRVDLDVAGVGRMYTVCLVADWSGRIAPRTSIAAWLAAWHREQAMRGRVRQN